MAATIFGFSANEIKPQPGLQISRSEGGGYVATHEFVVRADSIADVASYFNKGDLLSDIDPSIPSPQSEYLRIDTVSFVRSEGDLITLSVTATGGDAQFEGDGLSDSALATYELRGQLVDSEFNKHRKWSAMNLKSKTLLGSMLNGYLTFDIKDPIEDSILYITTEQDMSVAYIEQFDPTELDAMQFASRIQQGQTTYQKAVYTWTESTEGNEQLTASQINLLGLLSTPRGDPPEPSGTRNWMLTSVSQSQAGELYRTTLEWTLSEEGGFDEFLYDA
jgi:hypothetical protein